MRPSRQIRGRTGGARFKRDATGRWFVSIVSWFDAPPERLPNGESPDAVGVDLGVRTFATLSDGTRIANPKFQRGSSRRLKRAIDYCLASAVAAEPGEAARSRRPPAQAHGLPTLGLSAQAHDATCPRTRHRLHRGSERSRACESQAVRERSGRGVRRVPTPSHVQGVGQAIRGCGEPVLCLQSDSLHVRRNKHEAQNE